MQNTVSSIGAGYTTVGRADGDNTQYINGVSSIDNSSVEGGALDAKMDNVDSNYGYKGGVHASDVEGGYATSSVQQPELAHPPQ